MSVELVLVTAIVLNLLIYSLSAIYSHIRLLSQQKALNRSLRAILQMQDVLSYVISTANPPSSGSNEEDEAEEAGGSPLSIDGFSLHLMNQFKSYEPYLTIAEWGRTQRPPVSDDKPNSTSTT